MSLKKFLRDESGAIMPIFAISLVPVIALVGASVDLAGVTRAHNKLQVAVDTTALAVNHELHLSSVQSGIQTKAAGYFATQAKGLQDPHMNPVDFSVADGRVDVSGTATYTPQILNAFGFGPYHLSAKARSVMGDQSIEVALVLDNSGSMASNGKLTSLQSAAKSLVGILFDSVNAQTRVKIALVPFSGAVNVGAGNATADWMDKDGLSPMHSENFVSAKNRFTLYSEMSTAWAGCVETRPDEHMTHDTEPTRSDPETLFVPMFAPDESDEPGVYSRYRNYINNYLSDDGVSGNCTASDKSDTRDAARQKRVCKYKGQTPDTTSWGSTKKGPNFWCNSDPIVPLTATRQTVIDKINAMTAKGYTNIHEGLMWGWRVLSPGAPFTEGVSYATPNVRKYIILMTDGANTINGRDNHNNSDYSAYGYASNNILDEDSDDMSSGQLKNAMDDRLEEACENAKNDDPLNPEKITIFTIAFQVNEQATLTRLQNCASSPAMAKTAASGTELENAFKNIAKELGPLRLTQ
jgi:Flp pilus assembly protein TadG